MSGQLDIFPVFDSINDSYLTSSKPTLPSEANCTSRSGKTRMAPDIRRRGDKTYSVIDGRQSKTL